MTAFYVVYVLLLVLTVVFVVTKRTSAFSIVGVALFPIYFVWVLIDVARSPRSEAEPKVTEPTGPKMWAEDPFCRHQYRYFNGTRWTDQVSDAGEQSTDDATYDSPTEYTGSEGVWAADPYGRYQYRFFDSTGWTRHASRQGDRFDDPAEHPPPNEPSPQNEPWRLVA